MYRRRRSVGLRPRRRLFSRRAVRVPTRAGASRWQWGNVFASLTVQATPVAFQATNIMFELASMEPNHFGDASSSGPLALAITQQSMIKGIDIGGIVYSGGVHLQNNPFDQTEGPIGAQWHTQTLLCWDKKNPSSGIPQGTNAQWGISTFPANVVDVTLPRPSTATEIRDYPSRIIDRDVNYANPALNQWSNTSETDLSARFRSEVFNPERHRSIRLRKRITDDWGLFFGVSAWPSATADESAVIFGWVSASIYFRVVY